MSLQSDMAFCFYTKVAQGKVRIWLRLWPECVHLLRSCVKPESPRVTVFKGGPFARWLAHSCGTFVGEINEFIKWKEPTSHPFCSSARLESMSGRNKAPQHWTSRCLPLGFIVFQNCEQCIPIGLKLSSLR